MAFNTGHSWCWNYTNEEWLLMRSAPTAILFYLIKSASLGIAKPSWINYTKPTQNPMNPTPRRSEMSLRNWMNFYVRCRWMIIMLCSIYAAASVLLTSAKPLLTVCNTVRISCRRLSTYNESRSEAMLQGGVL